MATVLSASPHVYSHRLAYTQTLAQSAQGPLEAHECEFNLWLVRRAKPLTVSRSITSVPLQVPFQGCYSRACLIDDAGREKGHRFPSATMSPLQLPGFAPATPA
jgi:hypothetical protein